MSIEVRVTDKKENWVEFDRPCFGFLSYIDQWDTTDIEDASSDDMYRLKDINGLEGFESENIESMTYIEYPFSSRSLPADRMSFLQDKFLEALKNLPGYYDNVSVDTNYGSRKWAFNFPFENQPMQKTVIGAMMIRNIMTYTSTGLAFEELCKEGIEPHIAFVLANAFPYSYNAVNNNSSNFYRNHSGDETIFPTSARICDLAAMIKGELPDPWQGCWGDTEDGYGRYGEYNGGEYAEQSSRTGHRKNLHDVVLLKEGYEDSPILSNNSDFGVDDGWGSFTIRRADMFDKIVPAVMGALKSGS